MATKKNLPNIPIYIGDWERDCNVLSLESEAAWMRIVFKLWTKGKQNSIKVPAKSLQNLWRCSAEKMQEILNDLIYNEICGIVIDSGFVEFTCRRFVKENQLSKTRSIAAKGSKEVSKHKTKPKQNNSKNEQNTEDEDEIEILNNKGQSKKSDSEKKDNFLNLVNQYADDIGNGQSDLWMDAIYKDFKIQKGSLAEIVQKFNTHLMMETNGIWDDSFLEYRKWCGNWIRQQHGFGKLDKYTTTREKGAI